MGGGSQKSLEYSHYSLLPSSCEPRSYESTGNGKLNATALQNAASVRPMSITGWVLAVIQLGWGHLTI